MAKWAHLGHNTKRWTINSFTYPLVNSSMVVNFSAGILTRWVPFLPPIVRLAAKNRFSRGFVWVQKGGGCTCGQNEFLFKKAALCTFLGAICSKMECVLVQNARWNGAKCDTKSIKIHGKWYKQNLLKPWNTRPKGAKQPSKSGVLGVKWG